MMHQRKDSNGTSAYTINELPTWDEVFREFYREESPVVMSWNTPDPYKPDPYYNIQRVHVLMGMVCNQFNKMIHEDGYLDSVLEAVKQLVQSEYTDCQFGLAFSFSDASVINMITDPVIYTFSKEKDIFAVSDIPRVYVEDISKERMEMYIQFTTISKKVEYFSYKSLPFEEALKVLMQPFLDYFMKPRKRIRPDIAFNPATDPAL